MSARPLVHRLRVRRLLALVCVVVIVAVAACNAGRPAGKP